MDLPFTKFDEYVYGESCPPISDDDGDDDEIVAGETAVCDGNGDLKSENVTLHDGSTVTREVYESLLNMVVPDTDDERDLSPKRTRSRRKLSFRCSKQEESVACESHDDGIVEGVEGFKDYSKPGDYEKLLGVFCPTFANLTPRRRKLFFP